MSLSMPYQLEINEARSGKVITRVINFINDLTDGDRVCGWLEEIKMCQQVYGYTKFILCGQCYVSSNYRWRRL